MDLEIGELMKKATIFHGHICPGVAIGVLVAKYALEHGFERSPNEELVAVVENSNCSVDALQAILSTTYGKGNLVHRDYGKNNYTIYSRKKEEAFRMSLKRQVFEKKLTRDERIKLLLESKPEDIFKIEKVDFDPPPLAQIEESIPCEMCDESTMSSRKMEYQGKKVCISCYKEIRK